MYFMPGAFGFLVSSAVMMPGSMITSSPRTLESICGVMYPGRKTIGFDSVRSIIVDSIPMPTGPPSSIIAIFPFKSSATWAASVGLGRPEVLALGAAMRQPLFRIRSNATGWFGIRTATVSIPPVVAEGTVSFFQTIMVRGPGQKASASFWAAAGIFRATRSISEKSAI